MMTASEGEWVEVEEARAVARGAVDKGMRSVEEGALEDRALEEVGLGGTITEVWFVQFVRMVGVCVMGSFVQIPRSLSSKRRVFHRASTTSTGERPANGFPLVAVGVGAGLDLTCLGFFMAGGRGRTDKIRNLKKMPKLFFFAGTI